MLYKNWRNWSRFSSVIVAKSLMPRFCGPQYIALKLSIKILEYQHKILMRSVAYTVHVWVKVQVWTLAIAPLTWVRLVTSSALQSRKWQLIGMSQWCRSALCGHPLPELTDNWTHGAASRHTTAPISHTRPSPHSRSYYSFPIPTRVGGWVGLSTQ